MSVTEMIALAAAALLAENLLLVRFLGAGTLLRQFGTLRSSMVTGLTVTGVMVLSAPLVWLTETFFLRPLELGYLRLVVFLLILALLEQLLRVISGRIPRLNGWLGELLPLCVLNSAVLGGALLTAQERFGFAQSLAAALFGGLGFMVAALLLASIRGRLAFSKCPRAFEGIPIALVTAGLLAMAFLGFSGLRL